MKFFGWFSKKQSDPSTASWNLEDFENSLNLAEHGDAEAQARLIIYYAGSNGIERNVPEMLKWCFSSAELGHRYAQWQLGHFYETGLLPEIPKDLSLALKHYAIAAEKGSCVAQWSLARMFRDGLGVSQNFVLAFMWCYVSAQTDCDGWSLSLQELEVIRSQMTPIQVHEAEFLARQFLTKHPDQAVKHFSRIGSR